MQVKSLKGNQIEISKISTGKKYKRENYSEAL
jgi:hypothetical protein